MDLTCTIYYDEPTRNESDPLASRWLRRGDIVAVDRMDPVPTEAITSPRCVAVHVLNAPEKGVGPFTNLLRMRARLLGGKKERIGETEIDPDTGDPIPVTYESRKRWHQFQIDEMNPPRRNELRNTRELTVAWIYFRDRVAVKTTVDPDDWTQDDLSVRLQDDDI